MKSPELFYLGLTALMTGILWIPYVIGLVSNRGLLKPADYVHAPTTPLPDWVNRANRAHLNAVENLAPFAAIVLTASVSGYSTETTQLLAAVYFFGRVAHAAVHITGISRLMARTVIFGIANTAMMLYGILVLISLMS